MIIATVSRFILRSFGWHTSGKMPGGITRAIMIVAPHTSTWDFVVGRLTFWESTVKVRVLIKKEAFVPFLGWFLRILGGVPVDRGKKNNMIIQVADLFKEIPNLVVVITPEGTRKKVRHWKKGFYLIAMEAKVPIALAFIDYGKKTGGIGQILYPSGNYEKDLEIIQDFYKDKTARHPERFTLPLADKEK
ncbi:MAG: 1-acyl-sn-glycerol-3-phosphate acyltransferase [Bacteroidetes bacterium]|nr:1-acyl-sn-glycerol-3-phosphate acyltransferase [Bacteroidota bacterium]